MSAIGTILNFVAPIVSTVYPPAAPIIGIIQKLEPYAETALPLLQAAIKEGPAAFAAFKEIAPEFTSQLRNLAAGIKIGNFGADLANIELVGVSDQELATLGAHIVGVDPPGWTHEETLRWWDKAQGNQGS